MDRLTASIVVFCIAASFASAEDTIKISREQGSDLRNIVAEAQDLKPETLFQCVPLDDSYYLTVTRRQNKLSAKFIDGSWSLGNPIIMDIEDGVAHDRITVEKLNDHFLISGKTGEALFHGFELPGNFAVEVSFANKTLRNGAKHNATVTSLTVTSGEDYDLRKGDITAMRCAINHKLLPSNPAGQAPSN